ncbi:putative quinol monooxygenase [Bradyrhizobium cenepequi]
MQRNADQALQSGAPLQSDTLALIGSEVAAISEIRILPGHLDAVRKAVDSVRAATLKDPGCLVFFATTKEDDSSTIILFEVFRSQSAFAQHGAAEATQRFLAELRGRVERDEPAVTRLQQTPGPFSSSFQRSNTPPRD